MPRVSDTFLAELGLERSGPRADQWGDDAGRKIWRAGLTHAVMSRMLEEDENLASFLKLDREVVFGWLRDLVVEESERSPFGLVPIEQEGESERDAARFRAMSLQDVLAEWARLADARHGWPRAPEWAVALDAEDRETGGPSGG